MTSRIIEALNKADYYKRLYANAQSTVDFIFMRINSDASEAIKILDIKEAIQKEYKNQHRMGARE